MPERSAAAARRPRPALLVLLAVSGAAALTFYLWPAAEPPRGPSNSAREQRKQLGPGAPDTLDVRLEALKQPPPVPAEAARNPFRFYVKPPPPPPPPPPRPITPAGRGSAAPAVPAGPPPISSAVKFIGTLEVRGRKVAIFASTDNRGMPVYAGVGETVFGQYRVVSIGVESVTLEYLDGRGRQTIPMRG